MSRPMACAMEQESRIAFTALIIVGTQACQHFDSGILVVFTLPIGEIGRQFEQRGSYYGRPPKHHAEHRVCPEH